LRGLNGTGGASAGPYRRFNLACHVGDAPEAVEANRRLLRTRLELPTEPAWLKQVHGSRVLDLDPAAPVGPAPEADASVTRTAGTVCVVQVADCLPVLFASRSASCVGAAHAGWRGLAAGVLEATIKAFGVAPAELVAWLGPSIGPEHFEVGDEVREAFVRSDPDAEVAFTRNARGRWQCDLPGIASARLRRAGIGSVAAEGACVYADAQRFYSYRRDGQCGRMAALIWLAPAEPLKGHRSP